MAYAVDPEGYMQQLETKLQPQRIRATLSFAGLYQITHEMIKQSVLEEVRLFYRQGFDETGWQYDEDEYKRRVLSGAPTDRFRASLLWLVDSEAITLAQADRLDAIYAHRHELSHELIKFIVDPEFEPSLELFTDALAILGAIRRFWSSVEKDIGSFEDFGDVDLERSKWDAGRARLSWLAIPCETMSVAPRTRAGGRYGLTGMDATAPTYMHPMPKSQTLSSFKTL